VGVPIVAWTAGIALDYFETGDQAFTGEDARKRKKITLQLYSCQMKPVKFYLDYRTYLLEFYEEKKKFTRFFSYRYMAKRLGVDHTYVLRVLSRKSHLAYKHITAFVSICGLHGSDAEYFRVLVRLNKSKEQDEILELMERLTLLAGVRTFPIQNEHADVFKSWHHLAIRAMLGYKQFDGDFAKLADGLNPRISEAQARESVGLLERLNLVRKNPDGGYVLAESLIATGLNQEPEPVRRFQQEMLELGRESIDRHPKEVRDISTVTMAIKLSDMDALRNKIYTFRQEIMGFAERTQFPDTVFQLNIAFFPLSQLT
jgi:uncharacterized protein (TIGR02147 family)